MKTCKNLEKKTSAKIKHEALDRCTFHFKTKSIRKIAKVVFIEIELDILDHCGGAG